MPAKREVAFLSGFVETMYPQKSLPVDILSWICEEGSSGFCSVFHLLYILKSIVSVH